MTICKLYTAPDVDVLDIRNVDLTAETTIWSRGGEKRLVPKDMAMEAARLLSDGMNMVKAGRMPVVPAEWYSIHWSSCKPIHTPSHVTVTKISDET